MSLLFFLLFFPDTDFSTGTVTSPVLPTTDTPVDGTELPTEFVTDAEIPGVATTAEGVKPATDVTTGVETSTEDAIPVTDVTTDVETPEGLEEATNATTDVETSTEGAKPVTDVTSDAEKTTDGVEMSTEAEITSEGTTTAKPVDPTACEKDGIYYANGAMVSSSNKCDECFCFNGRILCSTLDCIPPKPNCLPGSYRTGSCCPDYDCRKYTYTYLSV